MSQRICPNGPVVAQNFPPMLHLGMGHYYAANGSAMLIVRQRPVLEVSFGGLLGWPKFVINFTNFIFPFLNMPTKIEWKRASKKNNKLNEPAGRLLQLEERHILQI